MCECDSQSAMLRDYDVFYQRARGEGLELKKEDRKLREAKARSYARARVGGNDVVGKVMGVDLRGVRVAGRGKRAEQKRSSP